MTQCSKRHDRNIVVDPLWYTQPVEDCKGVSDVVVVSKPEHQTSCSVEHRLQELSLKIGWWQKWQLNDVGEFRFPSSVAKTRLPKLVSNEFNQSNAPLILQWGQ